MSRGRKWTKEDEEILVQAIKANPYNITDACRSVSYQLDRSIRACYMHWYLVLSPKHNTAKTGVSFIAVTTNSCYINRKNSGNAKDKPLHFTLLKRIKRFFKELGMYYYGLLH